MVFAACFHFNPEVILGAKITDLKLAFDGPLKGHHFDHFKF
jgi:hypothetical protein